jgi:hypothetical protein
MLNLYDQIGGSCLHQYHEIIIYEQWYLAIERLVPVMSMMQQSGSASANDTSEMC